MPTGTVTVTVTGTGLGSSSTIWVNGVQYGTQLSATGTLSASIYLGAGTSAAAVSVNNSGTFSNTVTVPMAVAGAPSAPASPPTSASGANPAVSLASVSPNPLPTGTVTVSLTGTGFTSSSTIWDNGVQYAAQLTPDGALTTSVYTAPGTASVAFSVHAGGSVSNALSVPVAGPPTYALTVVNGTGGGSYLAGATVTLTANAAPSGDSFAGWTGATVSNANATTTTLTMPASDTTVTANFASGPTYALTVVGGQGSGSYVAGSVVTITANNPAAGQSFLGWTGATVASSSSSTTTVTMPASAVTVTANFSQPVYTLTVVNGTGGGSYAPGAVVPISVNTPPAGEYFTNWSGSGIANAALPSTTVTMPQGDTTVTADLGSPAPVPFPVSAHPRLWVTPADLPRLQGWATSGNPIYMAQSGVLGAAIGNYNLAFPGAALTDKNPTPASPYPDLGDTQGYSGILSEENAMILAFNSMIDPSAANRIAYAQAARNLLMYAINQAALGALSNAPFRDPLFPTYNRASYSGHEWALAVDWIYDATDAQNNPILTAADKAAIQTVFLQWCNADIVADTTGGDNPGTPGLINSPALIAGGAYRYASNNYYLAHARNLTMMALALDPSDDPPVNPVLAPSAIGNSLRSFIADGTGAWLYQEYAMMGDPASVAAAYHLSNNPAGAGFGLASGGLPPEGFLYGESYGYLLGQLLALQTSGFNNPGLSGPQIALIGAPVWDRYVTGFISSLTPAAQVNPGATYYGPVYQFAGYGDMLREYVTPDFIRPFAMLALLDQENGGQTQHLNAARWFTINAPTGGASTLISRVRDPWTWGAQGSILTFMLLDPAAPAPTDPRPGYPTLFYDAPAGRLVAHTNWTPGGTMFDYKASWQSINHQDSTGGQFELFRNGEWLTKEMSNYDNNAQGSTTVYHNTLALQNWCPSGIPSTLNWAEPPEWNNGSEWMWGESAGDPTTITSNGPGYVYAASDLTNLFNRPSPWSPANAAVDVTQATRSILWLSNLGGGDYIVVYDRAATVHSGLFKRFNLSLVAAPVIQQANGVTVATETMGDGQQLFIQTLLPQNAAASSFNGAANLNPIAELEPTQFIYTVQDPTNPTSTRFLHVLQGANGGVSMVAASYVQSSSGTPFDGAAFGATEVFFPVGTGTPFDGTTLPAAAGVHSATVTGLAPNTGYSVTVSAGASGNAITISAGAGPTVSDAAGVIQVSF